MRIFLAENERKNTNQEFINQKNIEQSYLNIAGNILLALDKHFKIAFLNKKGYEILGYKEGELKEKNWEALLLTEERKEIRKFFDDWVQGKSLMPIHHENYVVTKSGERRIISWYNVELKDEKGQLIGTLSSGEDITERKKSEEMLSKQAKKTSDILESIGDGFFALDSDLNFTYVNKRIATIYGFEPKNLIGRNLWEFFPNDRGSIFEEIYREVLRTKIPKRFDYKSRIVKGWFEYNVFPTADGILIFVRDITDRKELQEKLEVYANDLEKIVEERTKKLKDSERLAAIGATAGMVGHDIRNPLQGMISDVYLLREAVVSMSDGKSKQDAIESLDSIENNIGYINKIVADLQDYYKLLKPEHINVNLYELTINVLKPMSIPDNIQCSFEIDPSIRLRSDPTLISRILTNLITNAIQAMLNGGKLLIGAYRVGGNAEVEVTDTGVGIPEHIKDKLFTPMFTTKAKGQGLGLAVVKRLVEALNGTVGFESEEGKGAKFIIQLPLD